MKLVPFSVITAILSVASAHPAIAQVPMADHPVAPSDHGQDHIEASDIAAAVQSLPRFRSRAFHSSFKNIKIVDCARDCTVRALIVAATASATEPGNGGKCFQNPVLTEVEIGTVRKFGILSQAYLHESLWSQPGSYSRSIDDFNNRPGYDNVFLTTDQEDPDKLCIPGSISANDDSPQLLITPSSFAVGVKIDSRRDPGELFFGALASFVTLPVKVFSGPKKLAPSEVAYAHAILQHRHAAGHPLLSPPRNSWINSFDAGTQQSDGTFIGLFRDAGHWLLDMSSSRSIALSISSDPTGATIFIGNKATKYRTPATISVAVASLRQARLVLLTRNIALSECNAVHSVQNVDVTLNC